MVKRPTPDFWDASHHTQPEKSKLKDPLDLNPERDKHGAGHIPKPPRHAKANHPTMAPPGMVGTKRGLPTPKHERADDGTRLTGPGDLSREFKPIARGIGKDRGHDR